jgi:hypothetical protein
MQVGEQAMSSVRRIVAMILTTLALMFFVSTAPAAQREEFQIAYYVIDSSGFQDKMQYLIAEIANDTLSQHIERQFYQETGAYAFVDRLYELPEVDRQNSSLLMEVLASQEKLLTKYGFDLVVVADLSVQERGYLVRVTSVDLRSGPGEIDWRGTPSLAVLEPTGNFVEVERKMEAIARRIALRYTGISARPTVQTRTVAPVLFWCIQSANPGDPELAHISRRLTLELPFFLGEQRQELEVRYDFTGISARDYIGECLEGRSGGSVSSRSYLDAKRFTYMVSGIADIERDIEGNPSVSIEYLFDWRTEGYAIPRRVTGISVELDEESLKRIAKNFLKHFSAAIRRELVKSTQINLLSLGFYKSSVDGIFGPDTEEAIKTFQEEFDLENSGTITPEFVEVLRKVAKSRK